MVRMTKFQTSSFRIGSLEGTILYRLIVVAFIILLAIFYLGLYGLISLILLPIFLLRIQHDYVDEYILKKIRGITVSTLHPLITKEKAAYEVFGSNYGLSEQQDGNILYAWTAVLESFSEDMTIIRHPYQVPFQRFIRGVKEYDSLFSNTACFADAYFITISNGKTEDFEKTLRNYGIPYTRLNEGEVEILNGRI
ncbi:MAG: hypothetical protein M0Z77_10245 [Thermoplasmatales archaeon]|jgi:hypothetical protein|nr:hypothetical protein [Thermoplasmatales archaeon]